MFNRSFISIRLVAIFLASIAAVIIYARPAHAQTTAFSYQGKMTDGDSVANGAYDFQFKLFNLLTGGTQQGPTLTLTSVSVTGGVFAVQLDFGVCPSCFPGAKRYLEIAIKLPAETDYTILSPRQQVLSAPYALKSANAFTADSLSAACVGCVTSSQIASVDGSSVTGEIPVASVPAGSASYVQNTTSQQAASNFNISGNGVVGGNLGIGTPSPIFKLQVEGGLAFFGSGAVASSLEVPTGGELNISSGSFPDFGSRFRVTAGGRVGIGTTNPLQLLHLDAPSARLRLHSTQNDILTVTEYVTNTREWNVGAGGSAAANGLSNTFFIADNGIVRMVIDTVGEVGIGTTDPRSLLTLRKDAVGGIGPNLTLMNGAGGAGAEVNIDLATYDPGSGFPSARIQVSDDGNFSGHLRLYTKVPGANTNVLAPRLTIRSNGNVGINTDVPQAKLDVNGDAKVSGPLTVGGTATLLGPVNVPNLGVAGIINLCYSGDDRLIAQCSSSARYKNHILPLDAGLDMIKLLRPVTFDWRTSGERDLGLIAEEVEKVEPLLTTRNQKGEIEGVKYTQLTVVLINAIKEQQKMLDRQQKEIDELKRIVCASNPQSHACSQR
jgi:hypothetical protein